jgi:hypothetical protein
MARYVLLVVAQLAFSLTAQVLAPLLSLFTAKGWPSWGAWFWTPDNDPYGDRSDWTSLPVGSYWRRVLWLWRNSGYGFDATVVSVKLLDEDVLITSGYANNLGTGPAHPGAGGTQQRQVWRKCEMVAWEWYRVVPYEVNITLFGVHIQRSLCVRSRFGWKIPIGADGGLDVSKPATLVASFNPCMGFQR